MPTRRAALKSLRQDKKRRRRNTGVKTGLKAVIKGFQEAVASGNTQQAISLLKQAQVKLDKAASQGIIHPNRAARKKSRLMQKFKTLSGKVSPPEAQVPEPPPSAPS